MAQRSGTKEADLGAVSKGVALAGAALALDATFYRGQTGGGINFFLPQPGLEGGLGEKAELFVEKRGEHRRKEAGGERAGEKTARLEIKESHLIVGEEAEVVPMEIGMVDPFLGEIQDGGEETVASGGIQGAALGEGGREEDGEPGAERGALGALGEDPRDEDAAGGGEGEVVGFAAGGRGAESVTQADADKGEEMLLGEEDTLRSGDPEDAAEDAFGDDLGAGRDLAAEEERMGVPFGGRGAHGWGSPGPGASWE